MPRSAGTSSSRAMRAASTGFALSTGEMVAMTTGSGVEVVASPGELRPDSFEDGDVARAEAIDGLLVGVEADELPLLGDVDPVGVVVVERRVDRLEVEQLDERRLLVHWQRHKGGAEHARRSTSGAARSIVPATTSKRRQFWPSRK